MSMVTLRDQLRDPIYKKWFAMPPKEKPTAATTPAWYVYVQEEPNGKWRRAEFKTWAKAYKFVAKNIKVYYDMSLTHKRQQFKPPVVNDGGKRRYHYPPADFGHHWCGHCRRMTEFLFFKRHHALPKWADPSVRRCSICGIRQTTLARH